MPEKGVGSHNDSRYNVKLGVATGLASPNHPEAQRELSLCVWCPWKEHINLMPALHDLQADAQTITDQTTMEK